MDFSALIFVAVALGWACYLLPKALKHHDEVAAERLEESQTDRARVLSRRRTSEEVVEVVEEVEVSEEVSVQVSVEPRRARRAPRPELSVAGRAARNRRRVLAALLLVLGVTWVFTWFAYLPAITPLWPTLLVAGWLVLARVSVVKMQRARRTAPAPSSLVEPVETQTVETVEVAPVETPAHRPATATELARTGFDARPEVVAEAEAYAASLEGDGSLWDPLPLTLPTYVGKATARRTVRTIELTGMTSSGHDDADSALARKAEELRADEQADTEQRRVAGA